ncbi:hypothetical protein ABMB44_13055 [Levilactobacillus brevis]
MDNNENASGARAATLIATGEVVTPEQFYQDSDGSNWGPAINKAAAAALQAGGTLSLGKRVIYGRRTRTHSDDNGHLRRHRVALQNRFDCQNTGLSSVYFQRQ